MYGIEFWLLFFSYCCWSEMFPCKNMFDRRHENHCGYAQCNSYLLDAAIEMNQKALHTHKN